MIGPKVTVVLQKRVETSDGMGGVTIAYQDLVEFKAVLVPLSGQEKVSYDKQTVFATHRLLFDYKAPGKKNISEVKEKNRIRYGTRYFDIKLVKNVGEANRHFELDLEEIT